MTDSAEIKDWLALCHAKARYCRLLDSKDWTAFKELFTEDYELDVSEGTGLPVIKGRDAALRQIQSSILTAKTAHQVHSPEILVRGDEARVVWALQDRVVWGPDRPSLTGYGHYHERWVRLNGAWKLAALRLTRLHLDFHPPVDNQSPT
jgi:SnoaL-like domain